MKRCLAVFLFLLCLSCRQAGVIDNNVAKMADLECRAIHLREMRFALANKIRFVQDTLLQTISAVDSLRLSDSLHFYQQQKETLLQASLQLADTIHKQLDSLRKFAFENVEQKHEFDKRLMEELKKRSCNQ
jgi:hypothetical protein